VTCHRSPEEWKPITSDFLDSFCPSLGCFLSKIPRWVRILLPALDNLKLLAVYSWFKHELKQRSFPNITSLPRRQVRRGDPGPESGSTAALPLLQSLPTLFPRVTTVDLVDSFDTFYETVQFICSFRELEKLVICFRIRHRFSALDGNIEQFRLPVGSRTVAVRCGSRNSEEIDFIYWLCRTEPVPQFTTLTFLYFDSDQLGAIV